MRHGRSPPGAGSPGPDHGGSSKLPGVRRARHGWWIGSVSSCRGWWAGILPRTSVNHPVPLLLMWWWARGCPVPRHGRHRKRPKGREPAEVGVRARRTAVNLVASRSAPGCSRARTEVPVQCVAPGAPAESPRESRRYHDRRSGCRRPPRSGCRPTPPGRPDRRDRWPVPARPAPPRPRGAHVYQVAVEARPAHCAGTHPLHALHPLPRRVDDRSAAPGTR